MLDLACGPGMLLASLASTMRLSVAADVTPKMIQMARAACRAASPVNTRFVESLAEYLPFATAALDCVVTRLSIHHFLDPSAVLREVKRVLKADGLLVIGDLVSSEDPAESRLHNALEQLRDPSHIRMLPESELLKVVTAAGFRVTSTDRWLQHRQFDEWAAIVANARSLQSLEVAMRTIAGPASRPASIFERRLSRWNSCITGRSSSLNLSRELAPAHRLWCVRLPSAQTHPAVLVRLKPGPARTGAHDTAHCLSVTCGVESRLTR